MAEIKGLIFDLDGVIVDTAKYHFLAWRRMANELGFDFDEHQNEKLKGISRRQSIELILGWGQIKLSEEEIERYMRLKNEWYLEYIKTMQPGEILPGAAEFLAECKKLGYKIALGSASKNALFILDKLHLTPLFDAVIDGNKATLSKPDPQVFLKGAEALGLLPQHCLVFEDAEAGVDAAHNGGMKAVGIGDPAILKHADYVIEGLGKAHIRQILENLI
jgi:beta-phosphoglucomutase